MFGRLNHRKETKETISQLNQSAMNKINMAEPFIIARRNNIAKRKRLNKYKQMNDQSRRGAAVEIRFHGT